MQFPAGPHCHQGAGKQRVDSYVVATGWERKLRHPHPLIPADTMTPWRGKREWKCQPAPPTTTSFPSMMLSWGGGSASHWTPLTLPGGKTVTASTRQGNGRPPPLCWPKLSKPGTKHHLVLLGRNGELPLHLAPSGLPASVKWRRYME